MRTRWLATRLPTSLLALAAALFSAGCARKVRVQTPASGVEEGIASWYGDPYHGRRAANGEVYDMDQLTAAHRSLAFETWVRVHNLENGKSVEVRITDRGPFVDGRIIDLSRAAARMIDLIGPGTARVRLQIIAAPEYARATSAARRERYAIQAGSFRDQERALQLRETLARRFTSVRVVPKPGDPIMWRVLVGEANSREEAEDIARKVRRAAGAALVVLVEPENPAQAGPPTE
jgi:rare lipoprotein A